ncbi:MAG: FliO/MopB family protein [Desulfurivibrionaceae bacterium]
MTNNFHRMLAGPAFVLLLMPVCSWADSNGAPGATGSMAPAVSFLKVMGAFALILGLMALLFIWFKKMGWSRTTLKQGSLLQVLDSRMITPKKSLIAVQVGGDEILILGVSENNITLLSRLEHTNHDEISSGLDRQVEAGGFASFLKNVSQKAETRRD